MWHFTKKVWLLSFLCFSFFFFRWKRKKWSQGCFSTVSIPSMSCLWFHFPSSHSKPTKSCHPCFQNVSQGQLVHSLLLLPPKFKRQLSLFSTTETASTWYFWEHPTLSLSSIHPKTREIFWKCESDHGSLLFTNPHGLPGPSRVLMMWTRLYFLLHLPQFFPDSLHFSQIGFLSVL